MEDFGQRSIVLDQALAVGSRDGRTELADAAGFGTRILQALLGVLHSR